MRNLGTLAPPNTDAVASDQWLYGNVTVKSGGSLTIESGASFTDNGSDTDKNIVVPAGGTLTNNGTIANAGTFTNTGTVTLGTGATLQTLNGAGTAPVITVGAGAGSGGSVGGAVGHDIAGSFVVTTAGSPAAGSLATVVFGTALAAAPVGVIMSAADTTGGGSAVAVAADTFSMTGFTVVGPALTTANTYLISYLVVAS
jgi:hypothetical protein